MGGRLSSSDMVELIVADSSAVVGHKKFRGTTFSMVHVIKNKFKRESSKKSGGIFLGPTILLNSVK